MSQTTADPDATLLRYTADIVSAHIRRNQVPTDESPSLIQAVHAALGGVSASEVRAEVPPAPAVPVKRSVFPDYIVCLEDGRRLKTLKRHLQNAFGLTPAAYRERWGLPAEYPMTAPNYTEQRSALAKKSGLGRKGDAEQAEPTVQQVPEGQSGVRKRKAKTAE